MKISFRSDPPFPSSLLSDGSLGASGITEHQSPYVDNKVERCLVEGENRLWAEITPAGNVMFLECGVGHDPSKILDKLRELSGSDIVSEFEAEYWGLETQEELDDFHKAQTDRYRQELYQDLLRYTLGRPGLFEWKEFDYYKAEIAKHLIAKDPSLALEMDALLAKVDMTYRGAQNKGDLPPI
jgi:hypothetical protein